MIITTAPGAQALGANETKAAYDYLARVLVDKKDADMAISAFHAAEDPELTPLFVALATCGDKRKRLLATTALGKLPGTSGKESSTE